MPKPTPVYYILRELRWRPFSVEDAARDFIYMAGESDVAQLVAQLPPEVLDSMRQKVADAPTTEEGWEQILIILICTARDLEAAEAEAKAGYRRGVEALRQYYASRE